MTRLYTATERKEASRQALALLTAAHAEELVLVTELIGDQGDNLPIVTATLAGFTSGLLRSFDDECEGAAECWLSELGQSVEAMPEGGE